MFKFSIREIVLVTLVVGIGLGWSLDRTSLQGQVNDMKYRSHQVEWNALVKLIEARGGEVEIGKGVSLYLKPGTPGGWTHE